MARQTVSKGGMAKIRFVMVEAEIPEGDIPQVTTAIQNALRQQTVHVPRVPPQPVNAPQIADKRVNGEQYEDDDAVEVYVDQPEADAQASDGGRTARPRKPPRPRFLSELDLDSGVSFSSFVEEHLPKTERDKNLVVAAYLKEHRQDVEAVTKDHVYSCFKKMEWSTGKGDFSATLRKLKQDDFLDKVKGGYVINHIGEDRVRRLRNAEA